jgi:DNA replication and repair protein RecF
MAAIRSLRIQHFRNLSAIDVANFADVNFFWGDNGSGKTSLLEAIYFAGTGRSFRGTQIPHVIQHSENAFRIGATVYTDLSPKRLSIQRSKTGSRSIQWDGKKISSIAPIAQELPLQFVSTLSYRFFTDGPKVRRQFFDWAVFHVKPHFYQAWKKWQRLLVQRNAALKQRRPKPEVQAWDQALCELAGKIDEQRLELVSALSPILNQHLTLLSAPFQCQLHYTRGWDASLPLRTVLSERLERDYHLGYTSAGPQRADFQLLVNDLPAVNVLSQGQQKLSMYAMHLSQGYFLQQETGKSPIYLIDDMASELDPRTQDAVLTHLTQRLNAQLFLTGITEDLFTDWLTEGSPIFHVSEGNIRRSTAKDAV